MDQWPKAEVVELQFHFCPDSISVNNYKGISNLAHRVSVSISVPQSVPSGKSSSQIRKYILSHHRGLRVGVQSWLIQWLHNVRMDQVLSAWPSLALDLSPGC